ncbi:MAG: hypothetical protein QF473_16535 [Planctomycetota bacterium]|jgi:hypothetical protein|nr:hypothetical protein [Planctomycetota bacterium]
MEETYKVFAYVGYLFISICLTIWVARTLSENGRAFLIDAFRRNEELADSINHLLVVGFYLINIGYIGLTLKSGMETGTLAQVIEFLSHKIGVVLITLGVMHFFNIYIFNWIRRKGELRNEPPPVAPQSYVGAGHASA